MKVMGRLEESLIIRINGYPFNIHFREVEDPSFANFLSSRWRDEFDSSSSQAEETDPNMEEHGEILLEEEGEEIEDNGTGRKATFHSLCLRKLVTT